MTTNCLHCGSECELVEGRQLPNNNFNSHRKRLLFWRCPVCPDSFTSCHKDTKKPVGYAADKETRAARWKLHNELLDPIWFKAGVRSGQRYRPKGLRTMVYAYLSFRMGIPKDRTHVGMFTIEQCREAWLVLSRETPQSILRWHKRRNKADA